MNKNRMMSKIVSMIMGVVMCMTMLAVLPEESGVSAASVTLSASDVVAGLNSQVGASYPSGMCLAYIADFWAGMGATRSSACCASKYGDGHIDSTSMTNIPVGADVYFGSCGGGPCGTCGNSYYGHIGIYVGNGEFVHATGGKVQKSTLSSWSSKYRGWGWHDYVTVNGNSTPNGCLDNYSGGEDSIYVRGWGFDPDDTSASARIDVYLWNPSDMTNPVAGVSTTANVSRVDVDNVFGCGANHGFEATLPISVPAGTYYLKAAVIDTAGGGAYWLDGGNVTITNAPSDTTAPTLTSVTISDVTVNGYKVTIVASDNVGVTKIAVPTWTDNAGQDDLFSEWWNTALATKVNATTWTYTVKVTDHKNERGWYNTDVYVYDAAGNETKWCGENGKRQRISVGLYTLNINPNGGSIKNESGTTVTSTVKTTKNKLIYQGTNHYSLTWTSPSRTGYTFTGYYTAASGGTKIYGADGKCLNEGTYFKNNTYQKASDLTVYAQWSANKYTVSFKPNGGTCDTTSKSVTYNSTYGDLPTPVWKGHVFKGWFTAETGGTQITKDSKVTITANQTLYAQWMLNSYTITLDSNDGSGETTSIKATWSKGYGTLPALTRSGYTFLGWFTAADGGTEVTASTTVATNHDHTLYAHWQKNTVLGDVNNDGILSVTDAVMMQKYLLRTGDLTTADNADLTGDGMINAFDLAVLKRKLLNE